MENVGYYLTHFESSNQKDQLAVHWYRPAAPKYLLQVVPGMVDHLGRYQDFGNWCIEHDILLVGFDLIGHGQSVKSDLYLGSFGSVKGFDTVVQDLTNFHFYLQSTFPDLPYFLLGHSMGSMWVRYLINTIDTSHLDGVLLSGTTSSPYVLATTAKLLARGIKKVKGPWAHSDILEKMTLGNYNQHFQPNKTHLDWLSRNEKYVAKVAKDPLSNFHFTTSGYLDLFTLIQQISSSKAIQKIDQNLPIYIFSGTKDYVAQDNAKLVRQLIKSYQDGGLNITYKLYDQGRHEMLNEINREVVYQELFDWMKAQ